MARVKPSLYRDDIIQRYVAGESTYAIAESYGLSNSTVSKLLHVAGIAIRGCTLQGLDDAAICEQYLAGVTLDELSQKWGASKHAITDRLKHAGISIRPRAWSPPDMQAFLSAYEGGESEKSLAERYGVSRPAIHRVLMSASVSVRSQTDMNRILAASRTPEERRKYAEAANAAMRGSKEPRERRERIAKTRQQKGLGISPSEQLLQEWLRQRGIMATPQLAIGPYNADLAFDSVAVEIFGGNFHSSGRHAARGPERYRYILNQGWNLVIIWVNQRHGGLAHAAADYLVSIAQLARLHPSSHGEYWVIWGNGEEIPPTSPKFYKGTFIEAANAPDWLRSGN